MVRARPRLLLLFGAVMTGSNLLRYLIGAIGGSDAAAVVRAAGWLFLVVRTFVTLWMHVATMRITADSATPWRRAFAVTAMQAGWFHLLALASVLTFSIRLYQGQAAGGLFVPASMGPSTALGLSVGLALTYVIFLPLQPGFARVLLRERPTRFGWSLAAIHGQFLRCLATVLLIAYPPALARQIAFGTLRADEPMSMLGVAVLDATMSVLLMLLATAVYYQAFLRGEAKLG
ncbi:MAG: hypothetical protein EOO78_31175 [Oxalobacteraceae bacterium]|nr:MAG: hypothetical protein EOO78_31175 [Oxalobacteraceae bacterium]